MKATAFKIRSPERDQKNDDARIERLDNLLENVITEVRSERNGLRARYLNSADSVIRPLEMPAQSPMPSADENTEALRLCILRLKRLDAQESVLRQMQHDLVRLQGISEE